jgi:hypothetical protein
MTNWNRNNDNAHQISCQFQTQLIVKYYKFVWFEYIMISCWILKSKWRPSSKASMMAIFFFNHEFRISYSQEKTYENESWHDEEDYLLQVMRVWRLLQSWKCSFRKQKIWKGLHESKVGQSWKKSSKIERRYQLQFPKKKVYPFESNE